jgi:hypothetical protein
MVVNPSRVGSTWKYVCVRNEEKKLGKFRSRRYKSNGEVGVISVRD